MRIFAVGEDDGDDGFTFFGVVGYGATCADNEVVRVGAADENGFFACGLGDYFFGH